MVFSCFWCFEKHRNFARKIKIFVHFFGGVFELYENVDSNSRTRFMKLQLLIRSTGESNYGYILTYCN